MRLTIQTFFKKFVFHNISDGQHFIGHTPLYNHICKHIKFKYNETFNLEEKKYNIWYVRNDFCSDYVYGDDTKTIKENLPNFIVDYVNNDKLILLLSTSTEFDTDHFWNKVLRYCESIGIDKNKIFILNSNFKTQIPNSFRLSFSGVAINMILVYLGLKNILIGFRILKIILIF